MLISGPSPENTGSIRRMRNSRKISIRKALLLFFFILTLALVPFRGHLTSLVLESGTLSNDSPTVNMVDEMIESSPHPEAAALSAWRTGKIAHRHAAIFAVLNFVASSHLLTTELEPMVMSAALDPDQDVRDDALRILRRCKHPALRPLAEAQLRDCDPEVRLLGLEYLKSLNADIGIPTVVPLLDDADPLVAANSLWLIEKWAHQSFGLRLTEIAAGPVGEKSGLRDLYDNAQTKIKVGAKSAKAWWATHQSEFASAALNPSMTILAKPQLSEATDFDASDLWGHNVRLSDLHGKVVVLHFWTASCPGCLNQLQDLGTLQKEASNHLAVVAVSLDNVRDDDGDLGGGDTEERQDSKQHAEPSAIEIQRKIAHIVGELGVNYAVILDRSFYVGGRFNAVDMPTTVIIDSQGFVRRRITGRRALAVLKSMVTELTNQ